MTSTATRRRQSSTPQPAAISPPPKGRYIDLGAVVADWIETNLVHGEGDFYGQPFLLDPFQRFLLRRLYLVDQDTLRRIVRRALLIGPKGWGKTALMAAVGLAELAGPTTVDRFGRPALRQSPNIPIAAASYEQTDRLFETAFTMADHEDSGVAPFLEPHQTEILVKDSPGRLFRVAAVGGTNEGGLPTAFIADEVHEWVLPRQQRVHLVIGNSLATKRAEGLELNISTPDDARPDSLLGKLVAYGEKVASGEIVDETFLYVRYSASEHWDLNKPTQLRKAIAEATPASWLDHERIAARFEIDRIPEYEFRRYHLGQFVRPTGSWLPAGKWEPLQKKRRVGHQQIVLAFDGSYDHRSAGLAACTLDGHIVVRGEWEGDPDKPDWRAPAAEVDAKVVRAFKDFEVVEFACDPTRWSTEIEGWAERYGEVVIDFPTNAPKRMVQACARFYAAVSKGEGLTHDGDAMLARHLHNAVLKETPDGAYIVKESRDSVRRINLATAAVIAYERAMWHRTNHKGEQFAMVIGG